MRAGHSVVYVGDRVRRRGQLNGKSSNLNHVILNKIYPHVENSDEVSWKDVVAVMDCDHLVRPPFFQKCCAVLLDKDVAVCLTPQSFHNTIHPDFFDNANRNFMFRLMPYYFGAGCCFITGAPSALRVLWVDQMGQGWQCMWCMHVSPSQVELRAALSDAVS